MEPRILEAQPRSPAGHMIPDSGNSCWVAAAETEPYWKMGFYGLFWHRPGLVWLLKVRPTHLIRQKPGTVRKAHDDEGYPDS